MSRRAFFAFLAGCVLVLVLGLVFLAGSILIDILKTLDSLGRP